ncbi:MAG: hypothetical protein J5J06_03480 [Phycisphaerae bacterium]|nr:hypothetical protein [Phycisphaerae bacterium]
MIRKSISAFLCVALLSPCLAMAGSMKDVLRTIPGDAMGVLAVPSLKQLDTDYQQSIKDLGLGDMVAPPFDSLIGMLKANLPMLEGIDEAGAFAVVVMPANNLFEIKMKQALIIPAKEPRAMLEKMGATPGEEDTWNVNFMGTPTVAMTGEKHITLAMMKPTLDAIKKSERNLADTLPAYELDAMDGLDIALWLDAATLVKMIKPMIDVGFAQAAMAAESDSGSFQAKQMELSKKQMDMLLDGAGQVLLGISVSPTGLGMRFLLKAQTGTELASQMQLSNTKDSLLSGIPDGKYLVAGGQVMTEEQAKASKDQIEAYANLLESIEGIDKAKLDEIRNTLKDWSANIRGLRFVAEMLSGGNDLLGAAVVFETTDGQKWISMTTGVIEKARELAMSADKTEGGELTTAMKALTLKRDAEDVNGVKVQQLSFDLSKMDVDEEDIEDINKVIGKEGITIRMGAAGDKAAVITFGGGKDYFARVAKAAKSNEAALAKNPGIQTVTKGQPEALNQVFFMAPDRILETINAVMTRMEEEPLPVKVPELTSPVAMIGVGGDGWSRMDLVLPMEVLKAGKDMAMTMMGAGSPVGNTIPEGDEE